MSFLRLLDSAAALPIPRSWSMIQTKLCPRLTWAVDWRIQSRRILSDQSFQWHSCKVQDFNLESILDRKKGEQGTLKVTK